MEELPENKKDKRK